jgi:hypothetical protein
MRAPNELRKRHLGPRDKKGWEVRFVVHNERQLKRLRNLILANGFSLANPFMKHSRWIQPLYGREAAELFIELNPARAASLRASRSLHSPVDASRDSV